MQKLINRVKKEKSKLFCAFNKNKIKHFLSIMNEVEDTNIQLEYEIVSTEQLEKAYDGYFSNKLARYEHLKQLIDTFVDSILGSEVKELPLVEKIFRFKKEFVYSKG